MTRLLTHPLRWLRLIRTSITMSLGQIGSNKLRSLLATLGIVIGIASVVAVIAALSGLKTRVLSEFEALGANKIFVNSRHPRTGPDRNASFWDRINFTPAHCEGLLDACPSVADFCRIARTRADVSYGTTLLEGVNTFGIDFSWHDINQRGVHSGRTFSVVDELNARPVCLITELTRDELELPKNPVGTAIQILSEQFTIIGVVKPAPGGPNVGGGVDLQEVYVPYTTLLSRRQARTYLTAVAHSPDVAEEASAEMRVFFRKTRGIHPGNPDTFRMRVLSQAIAQFQSLATGVTAVAGGIVSISLLVGGVGIMNIMLVSVSERTREIGLRKAVGAKPAALLLQFLIESATLCTVGGLMGVALGQGLVEIIKHIPNAQLEQAAIPLWAICVSLVFSTAVGITFGFFPALKAARLDPIEALRHE